MTRITIVNQHTNNFGDDIAGAALLNELTDTLDPHEIDIFYIWQRGSAGLPFPDPRCRHHALQILAGQRDNRPLIALHSLYCAIVGRPAHPELRRLVSTCKASDIVFVAPGGSDIGIYKDWMFLLVLVILVRSRVRLIFCQNTIASSGSLIFDALARHVLRRSTVFVREAASQEWLATQGIGATLGVDTAFLLAPNTSDQPVARRDVIAVVPTSLSNWHRDFRSVDDRAFLLEQLPRELSKVANNNALGVTVVPHLYAAEDERVLLAEIRDALIERGCRAAIADVHSYQEYVAELGSATAVVSMRYHGMIAAAMGGTPCVSLCYENKMVDASRYLAIEDLSLGTAEVAEGALTSLLELALAERQDISERLSGRVVVLRRIAASPVLHALSQVLRNAAPEGGPGAEDE